VFIIYAAHVASDSIIQAIEDIAAYMPCVLNVFVATVLLAMLPITTAQICVIQQGI